jgi:pyruvate dehydrogenase E2 component (dihydrolipoamide acetyltransferase)
MVRELTLPELGEGIETVEVTAVLVAVGDVVRPDQPVIEVETEKASLEVPSTFDGTITELPVKAGDRLAVGQVILRASGETAETPSDAPSSVPGGETVAAGTGAVATAAAATAPVIPFPQTSDGSRPVIGRTAPAPPSARALARQLGVDIHQVTGRGPGGRISREDVKAHAKRIITGAVAPAAAQPELPDFSQWGAVKVEPLTNLRRAVARNLSTAWNTVPHVTQFDHADITDLEANRKRLNGTIEPAAKLTMTGIVIKVCAAALAEFPKFNASLDLENNTVIRKDYCHIGFAADTERGLLVPVIRDVDRLGITEVATELNSLAAAARARKLAPDQMRGANFTVTNLGGLGTTWFSPIVNWPEVAILGVGRARLEPVHDGKSFQPRLILPLSLSYDHRLIDGADAARFTRWVAVALERPDLLEIDGGDS